MVVGGAMARARATLKKAYLGLLQNILVPFLYRSNYLLAHPRQRIRPVARSTFKFVSDLDFLLARDWVKKSAGDTQQGDDRIVHLCNISACAPAGEELLYCGKLTNWMTGLSAFRLNAFPSASYVFDAKSSRQPARHLHVEVGAPYDADFVEDIRIFESFGSWWGIGSVRSIENNTTRPVVLRFEFSGATVAAGPVVVLDEAALGGKLQLNRYEKNWTPVPQASGAIHFIQDHVLGNIVSLDTNTLRVDVLQSGAGSKYTPNRASALARSDLRIPSCPVKISRPHGDFLVTIGHKKLEGYYNHRIWIRSSFYQTFVVLMEAVPPYAIVQVSDPVYFDIAPRSYVFPFQLIEIPALHDCLLASLYIGGRYNEMLTIKKTALLKALPDSNAASLAHGA